MNTLGVWVCIVAVGIILAVCAVIKYLDRRNATLLRELEEWQRQALLSHRHRAPIVRVGKIEDGVMVGWAFYVRPGYHTILQTCPITGQMIVWGYSPQELHEIASRPAEFAQPELE